MSVKADQILVARTEKLDLRSRSRHAMEDELLKYDRSLVLQINLNHYQPEPHSQIHRTWTSWDHLGKGIKQ